jgi:hypothetical protein
MIKRDHDRIVKQMNADRTLAVANARQAGRNESRGQLLVLQHNYDTLQEQYEHLGKLTDQYEARMHRLAAALDAAGLDSEGPWRGED